MSRRASTDAELAALARRGDRGAADTLVRRYLKPALAVAWEYCESREDAEDVTQDAFHRALRHLDRFDGARPFRPWFFTILRNVARNALEARSGARRVPLSEDAPATLDDPHDAAERSEVRRHVERGAAALPTMQRACFRLCDVEGFSSVEVADMLGLSDGTVRTHLRRARHELRDRLRPLSDEETA